MNLVEINTFLSILIHFETGGYVSTHFEKNCSGFAKFRNVSKPLQVVSKCVETTTNGFEMY